MKNRIICVVACMMMLVGCLGLCSCGNYRVFDTTFTYSWAQIKLPDGTIVQGKVDNWTDYEGDQLQITIDGTTYGQLPRFWGVDRGFGSFCKGSWD